MARAQRTRRTPTRNKTVTQLRHNAPRLPNAPNAATRQTLHKNDANTAAPGARFVVGEPRR
eukprot:10035162-Lingulodinium_polyedra.AAC.1